VRARRGSADPGSSGGGPAEGAADGANCDGRTHTYGLAEGTSFAAPHVTGAVALLLSAGVAPAEAVERLRVTAVDLGPPGPDPDHGHGRIDVAAAMGLDGPIPAPPTDATTAAEPAPPGPRTNAPEPVASPTPEATAVSSPPAGTTAPDAADPPADPEEPGTPHGGSGAAGDPTVPAPPQAVALPAADAAPPDLALHLAAAALLGMTLTTWSRVARRLA
jgi:subtilisin family serine protease